MAREMFGDVVDPSIKVGTKKWYTVPLSILTHVVVLGAFIVIPLMATDMLPTPQSVMAFVAVPPPPPPPAAPLRVGGAIQEPKKVKDVKPIYPKIAQAAKKSGIVIIEAVISKEGDVKDAKILRGDAMLNAAALDAVNQWKYTPPQLNGVAVDVIMTVTVNFQLN